MAGIIQTREYLIFIKKGLNNYVTLDEGPLFKREFDGE